MPHCDASSYHDKFIEKGKSLQRGGNQTDHGILYHVSVFKYRTNVCNINNTSNSRKACFVDHKIIEEI